MTHAANFSAFETTHDNIVTKEDLVTVFEKAGAVKKRVAGTDEFEESDAPFTPDQALKIAQLIIVRSNNDNDDGDGQGETERGFRGLRGLT